MFKNKMLIVAMAAVLAMCVGLTACSGSTSASSSSAASSASDASSSSASASTSTSTSTSTSSSTASSSTSSNETLYWEGTLSDGSTVDYAADVLNGMAALAITKSDLSDATAWIGTASVNANGTTTLKDATTNSTVNYTTSDTTASSMDISIEGYGEAELKPISEADLEAFAADIEASAADEVNKFLKGIENSAKKLEAQATAQAKKLADEFDSIDDSTVFLWAGDLANGLHVCYMDNPESQEAFLAIINDDQSDASVWYGKYSVSQDGKAMTLTDSDSGASVIYTATETTPGTAMDLAIEGVGVANLKSVTKGDFVQFAEELAQQSASTSSSNAAN